MKTTVSFMFAIIYLPIKKDKMHFPYYLIRHLSSAFCKTIPGKVSEKNRLWHQKFVCYLYSESSQLEDQVPFRRRI